MNKGTNVGKAYVDGHFDGDGMNDEIVDSVAKAGPGVEREGEKQGERYGDGFGDRLRQRLERLAPNISKRLGAAMDGRKLGSKVADDIGRGAAQAHGAGWDDYWVDVERQAGDAGDRSGRNFVQRVSDRVRGMGDKISSELSDRIASRPEQVRRGIDRAFDDDFARRVGKSFSENLVQEIEKGLVSGNLRGALATAIGAGAGGRAGRGRGGGVGDIVGRMFGAGSRNNFLNFFGKSLGNVVNLTEKARRGIASLAGTFSQGFNSLGEGATFAQRTMAGLGQTGTRMGALISRGAAAAAASLPAATVAGAALLVTMSALVTVAGALVGIVTALAATITSALVGALAVTGGAILAVVAAGGLLTAAFMSMTNAQKDALTSAFTPLREVMTGIGQLMITQMVPAFQTWSANLQRAAALAAPAAQVMGAAFAEAGNRLTAAFSGPGFQAFANAMTTWLPSIVMRLSDALGGFLNGTMGLFAALMPMVNQFAGWLNRIATDFSNWANSAQGQNAIVDFVERALESLESLWGFTSEFFGFLGDLMFSAEGQAAGNTMFDAMRNAFEDFRAAIASGDLERWFDDAINLGSALWSVMEGLGAVFMALYNSGVLDGIALSLEWIGTAMEWMAGPLTVMIDAFGWLSAKLSDLVDAAGGVPNALAGILGPLGSIVNGVMAIGDAVNWVLGLVGKGGGGGTPGFWSNGLKGIGNIGNQAASMAAGAGAAAAGASAGRKFTVPGLRDLGRDARSKTYKSAGGTMPDPKTGGTKAKPKYENPYADWAQSLIRQGPALRTEIRVAVRELRREGYKGIKDAAKSIDHEQLGKDLLGNVNDMRKGGVEQVKKAQQALNTAARSLANANSAKDAARALKEVRKAQSDLKYAQTQQKRLNKAADIISKQRYWDMGRVTKLLSGARVTNATLADYALARESVAAAMEKANERLADAIAMRDDYANAVTDAAKAFGALTSAQAKTINGIEQALTAQDITDNLRDRLTKIRDFQSNLQKLLALGLSDAAYKQIVDAGVDGGSAYADALLKGGIGAIQDTNNLVSQIDTAAGQLGSETSKRLYQAGVDAAQGLLDGLTKLDKQLEQAAYKLGERIAEQVKKALGIKSPSRVMIAAMDDVGDGGVIGLRNQHRKVEDAATEFAKRLAPSPAAALDEARMRAMAGTVSGNPQQPKIAGDVNLTVVTPTEDPEAVANEAINELTGRLP